MNRHADRIHQRRAQRQANAGFSVVELLVVISIVAVVVSLVVPAVVNARAAARAVECKNNLRNLGIALFAFAQSNTRFPASGYHGTTDDSHYRSWVVDLLPYLDQKAVRREWDIDRAYDDMPNREISSLSLPVLQCPSDATTLSGVGNLSYVLNGGIGWTEPEDCPVARHFAQGSDVVPLDVNGNGVACLLGSSDGGDPDDRRLFFQLGMFFLENWPPGSGTVRHHTLDSVVDGLSNTLVMAENLRAGADPFDDQGGWSSPFAWQNSFFLSSYICKEAVCSEGNVDYSKANERFSEPYKNEAINSSVWQAEGQAPWPSSYHSGGVHVLFADGRVQFLSEAIAGEAYAALLSPQGVLIKGPLAQVGAFTDQ